jgi:hypothetical protein
VIREKFLKGDGSPVKRDSMVVIPKGPNILIFRLSGLLKNRIPE